MLCRQQLQAEEAQRREAQRTCDTQSALIEQLQAQAAAAAEERAELVAFQQSTDALREKYQRMADLAGDMQRVALETQVRRCCGAAVCRVRRYVLLCVLRGTVKMRGPGDAADRICAAERPCSRSDEARAPGEQRTIGAWWKWLKPVSLQPAWLQCMTECPFHT